jgi:hypothetical protein
MRSSTRLVLAVMTAALPSTAFTQNPQRLVGEWRQPVAGFSQSLVLFRSGKLRVDSHISEVCSKADKTSGITRYGKCYKSSPGSRGRWTAELYDSVTARLCLSFDDPKRGPWQSGCRTVDLIEPRSEDENPEIEIADMGVFFRADSARRARSKPVEAFVPDNR